MARRSWESSEAWAQEVTQEAGAGVVIKGTCVGLGVHVATLGLHHELADDLRLATCGEEHGLALTLGRTRGRQASDGGGRQLRQYWIAGRQHIGRLQTSQLAEDRLAARAHNVHLILC
jgi:hypothetical protein